MNCEKFYFYIIVWWTQYYSFSSFFYVGPLKKSKPVIRLWSVVAIYYIIIDLGNYFRSDSTNSLQIRIYTVWFSFVL